MRNIELSAFLSLEREFSEEDRLTDRQIKRFLRNGNIHFLGQMGGCVLLTRKNSKILRIYSVAIYPEQQGKGHGRRLLQRIEEIAKNLSKTKITLEVRESNHRAIKLYESMGYRIVKYLPNYYPNKENGIKYQKILSDIF